jgi:uncharacterized protein YbgA (DUF1722 family)
MQILNNVSSPTQRSFTDCLQQLRNSHETNVVTAIPNIKEWMQYWNDEESYAANLRNIRHWMERVKQNA